MNNELDDVNMKFEKNLHQRTKSMIEKSLILARENKLGGFRCKYREIRLSQV